MAICSSLTCLFNDSTRVDTKLKFKHFKGLGAAVAPLVELASFVLVFSILDKSNYLP